MNILNIVNIAESQFKKTKSLSNALKGYYTFTKGVYYGASFVIARATTSFSLDEIRAHYAELSESFDLPVCLYLLSSSSYAIKALARDGIPFYVEDRFAYIPFLSMLGKRKNEKNLANPKKLSMVCQHFVLYCMFNDIRSVSVTKASELIGLSKMSLSKAFDELESLQLPVREEGRVRLFRWYLPWGSLLKILLPKMTSPVKNEYRLSERIDLPNSFLSGISMLATKTQLGDNNYQTVGIAKNKELIDKIQGIEVVPYFEKPAQIITTMSYVVSYQNGTTIDPVSAWLSLPDNYFEDARVVFEVGRLFSRVIDGWEASWPLK